MIEAVNSVVSNAQVLRAVAEQTSTTQSFASNPTRIQTAGVTAPYLSPYVDLNGGSSKPILVVRDSETGDRVRQFPTEGQIRAYQRAQDVKVRAEAQMARDAAVSQSRAHVEAKVEQKSADLVENSVQFRQQRQEVKVQQRQSMPGSGVGGGEKAQGQTKSTPTGSSLDTEV